MSNEYLEIKNLNFAYPKGEKIFSDFSISLKRDEIYGLIGKNGSGKTTLLKIISGLLYQDSGTIILNNKDVSNEIPQLRNDAYLFDKAVLYPHLTVYQNLKMGLNYYKLTEEEIDLKIKNMLIELNLVKYVNFKPKFLSEGQKQLICIGKALIREPDLLLIDEAFSNLDNLNKDLCVEKILALKKKYKFSIIYVTHNFVDLTRIANYIIALEKGKIIFSDSTINCISSTDERIIELTKE